jgi:hypothetical protein
MSALARLTDRVVETATDDEIILTLIDTGEFFALTGTAAASWRLIDGRKGRAELIAALAEEFGVGESQIALDVDQFLSELRDCGLLASD